MPEGRFVQTRSLRVHLREVGTGEPVLFLHGFPQDSWMWRHQLAEFSSEWRCLAPDTRGFGLTEKPRIRVTRDLLARDVVDLLDALDIERVSLIGHDWGGIIASAAALRYPDRFSRLGLIDTLCSVWIPWGIHGWWFKDEPKPEQFFADHARTFIGSLFGIAERDYGGPPETPWAAVDGNEGSAAMAEWDPSRFWTRDDAAHFVDAFDDPDVWFHAIEYYRHALPFHRERADASSPSGAVYEFLSNPTVAKEWNWPGTLTAHPDWPWYPVFAPEDRHLTYDGPTMYLYSPFLVPGLFRGVAADELPPDDEFPATDPYAESFVRHFPNLRTRAARSGHFIPEEDPARTNDCLRELLRGPALPH